MEFTIKIPDQVYAEDPQMPDFLEALQMLVNRVANSHFKYGNFGDKYPDSAKAVDNAKDRIDMYVVSGNTEDMLDAANFCVIEHLCPSHAKAHFRAQSAAESPGIKYRED